MKSPGRIEIIIALILGCALSASAQDKPIGYWESHLPYRNALGVATDGSTLFAIYNQAFFTYDPSTGNKYAYAKEDGMSDIGMQCIGMDAASGTAILVYVDGNIDLFKNNTFYNIPDLKVKAIAGSKTVNSVYTEGGIAYLSTSLGVLTIDMNTHNVLETYQYTNFGKTLSVNSFIGAGDYFYAATNDGLFRAPKNDPALQNYLEWKDLDYADTFFYMATVNNTLFLANGRTVYTLVNDTAIPVYVSPIAIDHIDAGNGQLLISEFDASHYRGDIKIMNTSYQITDSCNSVGQPFQAVQLTNGSIWLADGYYGLLYRNGPNSVALNNPPGPLDPNCYDIYANNKNVWIAHGGFDDKYFLKANPNDISFLVNGTWDFYSRYHYTPFDTLAGFVSIARDEASGTLYFGSYKNGLFILNKDGSYQLLNAQVFDSSTEVFGDNQRQVTGVALDQDKNVWVTVMGQHQLNVMEASTGNWYKYLLANTPSAGGPITIDDNGQVWFYNYAAAGGVTVFDCAGTLSDQSDDHSYHLTTGAGNGNLPSNKVLSMAKDKNNDIWIGTDNGIGIVSNCLSPFTVSSSGTAPCDANIPIVQYDQFAGYLFAGSNVHAIAVDGANRKWVGTDDGVWLLSHDASSIIYRFTQDNSPLPSNSILKISIDKVTGDVYIGTSQGLITFRSTATEGGTSNNDVIAFPNPVPSDYTGAIAIKGLVANADVRITDIDGQLVYKTTALGGQAVWNGKDYTGHRPQSGMYLIFASSSDGSQTYQGKIVFMH